MNILTLAAGIGLTAMRGGGLPHGFAAFFLFLLFSALSFMGLGAVTASALDATSFGPILKDLYTDERIWSLTYKDNPFLKWIAKFKKFTGKRMPIPIKYGSPVGTGHTFATAQANIVASKYTDFFLTRAKDYGFIQIDHETLLAAKDDPGAFLRAKEPEIDGLLESMGRRMAIEMYGNGSGMKGQVDAAVVLASTLIPLANVSTVTNFEVDQIIKFASDNPATGVVGAGVRAGRLQIKKVDRDAGTLTVDQNISAGIGAAAAGDFIYIEGDYQLAATGLEGWLPVTAPTAGDAFFGVDRSVDTTRLAGVRYDANAAGDSPVDGLVKLLSKIKRNGGRPDIVFCSPSYWTAVELELGPKTHYYDPKEEAVAGLGFSAIRINYEGGSVPLVSDINCPNNRVYALQKNTLETYQLGEAPSIFDTDGLAMLRAGNADALNVQCYGYWNLGVRAPGMNGVANVAPQSP